MMQDHNSSYLEGYDDLYLVGIANYYHCCSYLSVVYKCCDSGRLELSCDERYPDLHGNSSLTCLQSSHYCMHNNDFENINSINCCTYK